MNKTHEPIPAPSATGPATCIRCQIANLFGKPICSDCRPDYFPPMPARSVESMKNERRAA